jgi:hypothetical protein
MPAFKHSVVHPYSQQQAVVRLSDFAQQAEAKYAGLVSSAGNEWTENRLTFFVVALGLRIQGVLHVHDQRADVEVEYPFAAAFFAGRLETTIKEQLAAALR